MLRESLKQLRESYPYSQNDVAEFLNISPQSVSKWERGEALPSVEHLPKLAKLFHCTHENKNIIRYPDQDVINIVMAGKIKYLDLAWNFRL